MKRFEVEPEEICHFALDFDLKEVAKALQVYDSPSRGDIMPWPQDDKVPVSLESIDKKLDKLVKQLIAPEALGGGPSPAPHGKPATTSTEAYVWALNGFDIDGYPHRWDGPHAGSTEDWKAHLDANPKGIPFYADWKEPTFAIVLLSQSSGLKTPAEKAILGFYATTYDETIKQNGWKTTTCEEWFQKIRATTGEGGASGDSA